MTSTPLVKIITDPKVDLGRNGLVVKGVHPGLHNFVKELGGRYSYDVKGFQFPPYQSYGLWIKETFPDFRWTESAEAFMTIDAPEADVTLHQPTEQWHKLYGYQRRAVNFLHQHRIGGLQALSPGLGKTAVALVAADMLDLTNVLIIVPLSLLRTWEVEAAIWTFRTLERRWGLAPPSSEEMKKAIASKGTRYEEYNWILTNYNTAVDDRQYQLRNWDAVIFDESILLKNRKTKRYKAAKTLSGFARRMWLLSGSPTSKFADDLWTQLNLIDPAGWPSYWRYVSRFCLVEETEYGKKIVGTRPTINFPIELRDVAFIRNQKDVLPDLPEMRFQTIEIELRYDQIIAHREVNEGFLANLESGVDTKVPERIAQLTRMQQITSNLCNLGPDWNDSSAKADVIVEHLDVDAVEFPMIIWTHWLPGAESIYRRLKSEFKKLRIRQINGQIDPLTNETSFEEFKSGQLDILILALGVGKFGHTLVNARDIWYLDKSWDADAYNQSLHRVKRIGLTHSPRVVTLKASGTVDSLIESNLEGKLGSIAKVSNADLAMLLRSL